MTKRTGHPSPRTAPSGSWCSGRLANVRWLDLEPPFCTAGVLVSADNRGVDDQVFEIGIIRHGFEDTVPNALLAPATEPPKDAVPIAEDFRQVTPGRPSADNPEHTLHKHSVIAPRRTALVRTADDQARDSAPLFVAQDQSFHDTQGCPPKSSLESCFD